MTERWRQFFHGARSAIPIILGYLPVAFAFGTAASGQGLALLDSTAISALMFSGANQAFFLSAVASGLPTIAIVAICAVASLRHILYGFVLRLRLAGGLASRLAFAFGLTDEVFATVLNATEKSKPDGGWIFGLAFFAWISWVAATFFGAWMGNILQAQFLQLSDALHFALPALFLGLVWVSTSARNLIPMVAAAVIAVMFLCLNLPALAIPGAASAALLARRGD
ncbi:AzlC family ABC transporter permease [Brucella melitensis]|uniref:AzlC family ABC transporter permease n=1 Tax=Brucella melitensis TaxID=29459 RepID=UPI0031FC74E5